LSMDAYHPNMTYCFIGADPNCREDECDQLNKNANALFLIFSAVPYFIFPCVIVLTMGGMYRRIKVQEKKLQSFGVGALSLRNTTSVRKPKGTDESKEDVPHTTPTITSSSRPSRRGVMAKAKSNKSMAKHSRAIMNRALSYSLAFFLTYLFPIVISLRTVFGLKSGHVLSILVRLLFPLQGFFNFIVFINPKVVNAKRSNRDGISWYRAFIIAVQSRDMPNTRQKLTSRPGKSTQMSSKISSRIFGKVSSRVKFSVNKRGENDTTSEAKV
jgi:hypothetical protein